MGALGSRRPEPLLVEPVQALLEEAEAVARLEAGAPGLGDLPLSDMGHWYFHDPKTGETSWPALDDGDAAGVGTAGAAADNLNINRPSG